MSSLNQKGGAKEDGFGVRSFYKKTNNMGDAGCGGNIYYDFNDYNLISLLKHGQFSLLIPENKDWNYCNRVRLKKDPAHHPVTLDQLNDEEIEHVLELINDYDKDMDFFSMITQKDVYDFFYKTIKMWGEPGDMLEKLQEKWRARRSVKKLQKNWREWRARRELQAAPMAAAPASEPTPGAADETEALAAPGVGSEAGAAPSTPQLQRARRRLLAAERAGAPPHARRRRPRSRPPRRSAPRPGAPAKNPAEKDQKNPAQKPAKNPANKENAPQ